MATIDTKRLIRVDESECYFIANSVNDCCLTDGADVLYNKFNVDSSSPPDNPPQHPNSDYNCVVATTGQWRVSRCDQQHRVVCQSDTLIGIMTTCLRFFSFLHVVIVFVWFASSVLLIGFLDVLF